MALFKKKKDDEEEKKVKQPEEDGGKASSSPSSVEEAQKKQPDNVKLEKTSSGVKAAIGPTNRPMTAEQSFLTHQRKAAKQVKTKVTKTPEKLDLPETLEPHRKQIEAKNKKGGFIASSVRDWGHNDIAVDFDSIDSIETLAYFGTTLGSDSQAKKLGTMWAERKGLDSESVLRGMEEVQMAKGYGAFHKPQSRYGQMKGLGLMDINGEDIDYSTATPEQIVQGIRDMVDPDKQEEAIEIFQRDCADKSSRFSGFNAWAQDYSFRDSSLLTQTEYKAYVKDLNGKFDPRDEMLEKSMRVYAAEYAKLEAKGKYVMRQELPALEAAFMQQMGLSSVPDIGEIQNTLAKIDEATEAANNAPDEKAKADIMGEVAGAWDYVKDLFSSDPLEQKQGSAVQPITEEEPATEEQAPKKPVYDGRAAFLGGTPFVEKEAPAAPQEAAKVEGRAPFFGGTPYEETEAAKAAAQEAAKVDMADNPLEALNEYVLTGKGDELTTGTQAAVNAWIGESAEKRALMGILTEENQAKLRNKEATPTFIYMQNYSDALGPYAVHAMHLSDPAYNKELTPAARGRLLSVVDEISKMDLTDDELALVEAGVSKAQIYHEHNPGVLQELNDAFNLSEEQLAYKREEDAASEQDLIDKARKRCASGYGTQQDWAMVEANAVVSTPAERHGDEAYVQYYGSVQQELDESYMSDDVTNWYNQLTLRHLRDSGLEEDLTSRDALRYKAELQSYTYEALAYDYDRAYTLGYESLNDYYAKTGTGGLESLHARALLIKNGDLAAAEEDIAEGVPSLSEQVYGGDGSTSNWLVFGAAAGGGLSQYGQAALEQLNSMNVLNNSPDEYYEIWAMYTEDGDFVGAADKRREELYAMIEGGYISNEALAKNIKTFLDEGGDPFALGIKPSEWGWSTARNAKRFEIMSRDIDAWLAQNASPTQGKYLVEPTMSTVYSTAGRAVSVAGSVALGWIPGGSMMAARIGYGADAYNEGVTRMAEKASPGNLAAIRLEADTQALAIALSEYGTDAVLARVFKSIGGSHAVQQGAKNAGASATRRFASAAGKALKTTVLDVASETFKDEPMEGIMKAGMSAAVDEVVSSTDELGRMPKMSELLSAVGTGIASGIDAAPEVIKEVFDNAGSIALSALPMSLLGGVAAGSADWKSTRAVKKAAATGSVEDAKAAGEAIAQDMADPEKAKAVDEGTQEAYVRSMAADIMKTDTGEIGTKVEAAAKAKEQADSHQKNYTLYRTANREAAAAMADAQEKINAGDTSKETGDQLEAAQENFHKTQHNMDDAWREYQEKKAESDVLHSEAYEMALSEAKKRVQVARETQENRRKAAAAAKKAMHEDGNAIEMEADAWIAEAFPDADEEQKENLRQIYRDEVGKQMRGESSEPDLDTQLKEAESALALAERKSHFAEGASVFSAADEAKAAKAEVERLRGLKAERDAKNAEQQKLTTEDRAKLMRRDRLATAISKRFGVNIAFVDRDGTELQGNKGGYSRKGNMIYLPTNATQSDVIRATFLHELTHRAEQSKYYDALADAVLAWKYGDDTTQREADQKHIKGLYAAAYEQGGRKDEFDADGDNIARSELVARAVEEMLGADEESLMRLINAKPTIARKIADAISGVINSFRGVRDPYLDQMRRTERLMRKALDEVERKRRSEYQQAVQEASHPGSVQFSVEQLAEATGFNVRLNDDGVPYTLIDKDGNEVTEVTPEMLKDTPMGLLIRAAQTVGTIDEKTATAQIKMFAGLTSLAAKYKDQAMVWEIAGSQMFSAIKNNSDKQYGTTVDFGTICAKTQAIIDVMSGTMLELGRGLTRREVLDAYRKTAKVGYDVPCPVCYVFSRWMGVPSLLGNMSAYQKRFAGKSEAEVRAYVAEVERKYDDGKGKPSSAIAKAKGNIEKKLSSIDKKMLKQAAEGKSIDALEAQAKPLQAELEFIEAYNWVTQVLCKKNVRDENGQVVLDPDYQAVPDEILLDLTKTGQFAQDKYKKSWTYRTTRGAGMGKSILPNSGARIGDTVKGTKDRWSDLQNAFLTGDEKTAEHNIRNAIERMKAQNLIGGQRFQSTSDYRPEWGIDYMMTFLEMQAIGAKGQLYTKVIEAVDMFASAGIEVNLSIMGRGNGWHVDENGNKVLGDDDFSNVTGIDYRQAREMTKKYDNVQMILVGLNDDHIKLAMANDDITFIIPWHSSGNSGETLATLMGAVGETLIESTDYTRTQSDKPNSKATAAQKAAMDLRMRLLTGDLRRDGMQPGDQAILDSNPFLADLYRRFYVDENAKETFEVELSKKQASQVFPYEYWDTSLRIEDADQNGQRFIEYCKSIGLKPRFPQFSKEKGYWKLLIDRRMYNRDGSYHHPKAIDVTGVKVGDIAAKVGKVKYGDPVKTNEAVQATLDEIRSRVPAEQYEGDASDIQFSISDAPTSPKAPAAPGALPNEDLIRRGIRSWQASKKGQQPKGDGVSQFASQTIQNAPNVPEGIKREFAENPLLYGYKRDTNAEQYQRAMEKIEENGYKAEVERLLNSDKLELDDEVEAGAIAIAAFDSGDIVTGIDMAAKYQADGTNAAQILQARQLFAKLSPENIRMRIAGAMENALRDIEKEFAPLAKDVKRVAHEHDLRMSDLKGGDELARRQETGYTITSESIRENKWGVPLNEKQKYLIDKYKLGKVNRPGIHYNKATIKQRMLEAILATPDPDANSGGGRTLTERLEWMRKGKSVATIADLQYIVDRVREFAMMPEADRDGRRGVVALGRALEAYGNITPPTVAQQLRSQRYVNMLLSIPSAMRNVIGNAGQNAINAATHDTLEVGIDWAVGKITGNREKMPIGVKERVDGWSAFADGFMDAFRDSFIDKVDTSKVTADAAKFDASTPAGRAFQNIPLVGNIPLIGNFFSDFAENARIMEGFLMSFGDRTFWKKSYANSIAEQQKRAAQSGIEISWDEMVKQAKLDANYATFNESGAVRSWLESGRKKSPLVGFFMDLYMPFVGIPLNIAKRGFFEYSPVNLLYTMGKAFIDGARRKDFDQKAFVEGVSRGIGGSGLMALGAWMAAEGIFIPGTGEEDDDELYNLRAAKGEQYSPFIRIGDEYISLSVFAPAIYPITLGATFYKMATTEDKALGDMVLSAGEAIINQFFDASFMSGLGDLFNTSNSSFGENLMTTIPQTMMSQNLPYGTLLGQWATAADPYVRDTKDASAIRSAVNSAITARIPYMREERLNPKYDVTGKPVPSKEGWRNFFDPFTPTKANDDPVLLEMEALYNATGSSEAGLTYLIKTSGKVTILKDVAKEMAKMDYAAGENKLVLTADQRNKYNQMYGEMVYEAAKALIERPDYEFLDNDEKLDELSDIKSNAKADVHRQICIDLGYAY